MTLSNYRHPAFLSQRDDEAYKAIMKPARYTGRVLDTRTGGEILYEHVSGRSIYEPTVTLPDVPPEHLTRQQELRLYGDFENGLTGQVRFFMTMIDAGYVVNILGT